MFTLQSAVLGVDPSVLCALGGGDRPSCCGSLPTSAAAQRSCTFPSNKVHWARGGGGDQDLEAVIPDTAIQLSPAGFGGDDAAGSSLVARH